MIWVLEGLNGVGKSAVAVRLAAKLGMPILRPFRNGQIGVHLGRDGDNTQQRLRALGVPANTFVDEIYLADFLVAANIKDAVLDRSIGSAIAYGLAYGDVRDAVHAKDIVAEWCSYFARLQARYVYMVADRGIRRVRAGRRWVPNEELDKRLEAWFDWVYYDLLTIPKRMQDSSDSPDVETSMNKVLWMA